MISRMQPDRLVITKAHNGRFVAGRAGDLVNGNV